MIVPVQADFHCNICGYRLRPYFIISLLRSTPNCREHHKCQTYVRNVHIRESLTISVGKYFVHALVTRLVYDDTMTFDLRCTDLRIPTSDTRVVMKIRRYYRSQYRMFYDNYTGPQGRLKFNTKYLFLYIRYVMNVCVPRQSCRRNCSWPHQWTLSKHISKCTILN